MDALSLSILDISTSTSIAEVDIVENSNDDLIFVICSTLLRSTTVTVELGSSGFVSSSVIRTSSVLDFITVKNISVIPSIT